jgi:hypothetical protein
MTGLSRSDAGGRRLPLKLSPLFTIFEMARYAGMAAASGDSSSRPGRALTVRRIR